MDYFLHVAVLICFYTLLAQSLDLVAGKTGMVSLAHAGFYGIGAYTTALLTVLFGTSFWFSLPLSVIVAGVFASVVVAFAWRTVDDYFIMCTLGAQIIIYSLMNNWIKFTQGPIGISGIAKLKFPFWMPKSSLSFVLISIALVLLIWTLLRNLSRSGFGKTLMAISEDEVYAQSIGKSVYSSKVVAFTLSAMIAAIHGALFARYMGLVDPSSFTINDSIFILSIVIIGGMGNLMGSFLASVFMITVPELLRFLGLPQNLAANMRQIVFGAILIGVMMRGGKGITEFFRSNSRALR